MAKGPGNLYKMRHIVFYRLSPFEIKAFHGFFSHGGPKMIRRIMEEFLYVVPPLAIGAVTYIGVENLHAKYQRKKPGDFDDEE